MRDLHERVFALSPGIRYVAVASGQYVESRSRPNLEDASASSSDRYEELLVNPTLLTLPDSVGRSIAAGSTTSSSAMATSINSSFRSPTGTFRSPLTSTPTRSVMCPRCLN